MKRILLILSFILLLGCVTKKETYLIVVEPDHVYVEPKQKRDTTYLNRFSKQFQQADSAFLNKLREASKEAVIKTNKHFKLKY